MLPTIFGQREKIPYQPAIPAQNGMVTGPYNMGIPDPTLPKATPNMFGGQTYNTNVLTGRPNSVASINLNTARQQKLANQAKFLKQQRQQVGLQPFVGSWQRGEGSKMSGEKLAAINKDYSGLGSGYAVLPVNAMRNIRERANVGETVGKGISYAGPSRIGQVPQQVATGPSQGFLNRVKKSKEAGTLVGTNIEV